MQLDRDGAWIRTGPDPIPELRPRTRAGLRLRLRADHGRIREQPEPRKVLREQGNKLSLYLLETVVIVIIIRKYSTPVYKNLINVTLT